MVLGKERHDVVSGCDAHGVSFQKRVVSVLNRYPTTAAANVLAKLTAGQRLPSPVPLDSCAAATPRATASKQPKGGNDDDHPQHRMYRDPEGRCYCDDDNCHENVEEHGNVLAHRTAFPNSKSLRLPAPRLAVDETKSSALLRTVGFSLLRRVGHSFSLSLATA